MSAVDLLLALAFGRTVSPADALEVLHSLPDDPADAARLERVARIKARNAALREAADELGTDSTSAWCLAQRVEAAILRFESVAWPRLRAGLVACNELEPHQKALYRAWLTGAHVPRTARRLYDIL